MSTRRQVRGTRVERQQQRRRVRLPVVGHMIPTSGIRREDCASYEECLTAHARSYSGDAHCAIECRWFKPSPPESATMYASSGRSSQEAAIYAMWGGA